MSKGTWLTSCQLCAVVVQEHRLAHFLTKHGLTGLLVRCWRNGDRSAVVVFLASAAYVLGHATGRRIGLW